MKFLITCAGTAGHINPALAIAGKLKELMPDSEFLFVGSGREMENRLIPMEGYKIVNIKSSGFQRKLSAENIVRNVKAAANIVIGSAQAKKLIREFKPDAAIGTGGKQGSVLGDAVYDRKFDRETDERGVLLPRVQKGVRGVGTGGIVERGKLVELLMERKSHPIYI